MTDALVIVFVKNIKLGTVKTRLAKTIGDFGAFEVYSELVKITEKATEALDIDKRIYFSNAVVDTKWQNEFKTVQSGADLGERMLNAFKDGFESGYKRIVLIGSDLPDINSTHIKKGIEALASSDVVFGPAEDGGYYLVGLSKMYSSIFTNKPWSQSNLLEQTLQELHNNKVTVSTLETLNDIDTYEDLIASDFYKSNKKLQE
ncbi:TIGR04282 family arsenosugar biosynthesis glycosyltransferase [Winogradskyella echinorum]|uniref:TIGR04282 family arsenosugar biosynthesis glycosyltransferase n=1 Tax=Winogradskyella echinorum TaxID=538189 RepID=A0ABR6XXT1_9FLAO|nr:TIGR04282 family arsenosugar biosynthesis glycosyltransferase [Winogradskyella echinorum]MBC3845286.1 TIGR04282 family arsenosugar biosynthesis glycosyltransferase [Winogradskyella echinorum]MBC5749634.1 TIGR04282 family arsenosugar biosynthesis glycosyltransferase [Winogradskyella echinorum]